MPESTIAIAGVFAVVISSSDQNGRTPDAVGHSWLELAKSGELDRRVVRDRQARLLREDRNLLCLHGHSDRADELVRILDAFTIEHAVHPVGVLESILGVAHAFIALDDRLDERVRMVLCHAGQVRVDIARRRRGLVAALAGTCERHSRRNENEHERSEATPALAPEGVGTGVTSAVPRSPKGTGAHLAASAAVISRHCTPFPRHSAQIRSYPFEIRADRRFVLGVTHHPLRGEPGAEQAKITRSRDAAPSLILGIGS